jgi:hypothetical protein
MSSIMIGGFTPEYFKTLFVKSNTYELLVTNLNKAIDTAQKNPETSQELRVAAPYVTKLITPIFIKQKIEIFIDDLYAWVSGKTVLPPSVSIIELKDIIILQNPQIAYQFQLKTTSADGEILPLDPEFDYGINHPTKSSLFNQAINNKLVIPVGKYILFIKNYWIYIKIAYWIITICIIFNFIGLYKLSPTRKSGLLWLSFGAFCSLIVNILPLIMLISPAFIISMMVSKFGNEFAFIIPILMKPILTTIFVKELYISGAVFIICIITLLTGLFIRKES